MGVGNEDFDSMDILDADDEPLYSMKHKKYMDADIVQFVPFRDFKNNPTLLAKETLDEVPRQLLDYMRKNHIQPNAATAEQKRLIQQKLAAQTKLGNDADNDEFFDIRKEAMISKMTEMGMDREQVADFIENRGMFEENPELIIDNLDNPRYVNTLRLKYQD